MPNHDPRPISLTFCILNNPQSASSAQSLVLHSVQAVLQMAS
jgi:hypothetical protein